MNLINGFSEQIFTRMKVSTAAGFALFAVGEIVALGGFIGFLGWGVASILGSVVAAFLGLTGGFALKRTHPHFTFLAAFTFAMICFQTAVIALDRFDVPEISAPLSPKH